MHICNRFCLRYTKDGKMRYCRCGAGVEKSKNSCDTPGFRLHSNDGIFIDENTKVKHLRLRRTTSRRMTQCSKYLLQSWRANCDVQILIYDSNPMKPNLEEIRRVTDYVVSYTTKVNQTISEERKTIKEIIAQNDCYSDNETANMAQITKQVLNSFHGKRLISRAEAMVEILDLPLIICSETIEPVNISGATKVSSTKKTNTDKNFTIISQYMNRRIHFDKSLIEFFHLKKNSKISEGKKFKIPHPVGRLSNPRFRLNASKELVPDFEYMRSTLILHKPWRGTQIAQIIKHNDNLEEEFNKFLKSSQCPRSVYNRHFVCKNHRLNKQKKDDYVDTSMYSDYVDTESYDYVPASDEDTENYFQFLRTKGKGIKTINGHNVHIDHEYRWDQQFCIVSKYFVFFVVDKRHYKTNLLYFHHSVKDNNDKPGHLFLKNEIQKHKEKYGYMHHPLPVKKDGTNYRLSDINGNEKQEQIVYKVISKLKEWIEYPKVHKENNRAIFEPLYLTVMGVGGTGKSFVISVIVTAIMKLFDMDDPSVKTIINAPTGAAAFNANGKTCHNTWKIPIRSPYNISDEKLAQMRNELQKVLFLCIDERSMLSKAILGAINKNARKSVHNNIISSKKPFGGIPIVMLVGDDHQLPSVTIGETGQGITYYFKQKQSKVQRNPNMMTLEKEGEEVFFQCTDNVIELDQIKRLESDSEKLKSILTDLRGDGIKRKDATTLLNLHVRNLPPDKKHAIMKDAVYLFATKQLKTDHNMTKLNELTDENNPVLLLQTQFRKENKKLTYNPKSHFERDSIPTTSLLCKEAKVAITGQNFQPNWGLYNGALGTVKGIKFKKDENPQTGHQPLFVVVDFPSYKGPPWIDDQPTLVPIPTVSIPCSKNHCCEATFIPLTLAFARTIHTFQGMEAGPSKLIKTLIVDVGSSQFESINPGVLYTALSRASTIGEQSTTNSAIYFSGPLTYERLTNVKYVRKLKNGQKKMYEKVQMRTKWIKFLKDRQKKTTIISKKEIVQLRHWCNNTIINTTELDNCIEFHKKTAWKIPKIQKPLVQRHT